MKGRNTSPKKIQSGAQELKQNSLQVHPPTMAPSNS